MNERSKTLEALRDTLAAILSGHERVALCFSGGKESLLLAHALRPWASLVELVTVNTGATFPHMLDFIKRAAEGFKFTELHSDVRAHIDTHGWPFRVIPIRQTIATRVRAARMSPERLEVKARDNHDATMSGPNMQDSIACCTAMRTAPLVSYIALQPFSLVLHGQREGDGAAMGYPVNTQVMAPLWDWTEAEVYGAIDGEGIELPEHYAEVGDSLDCWLCTAEVSPKRYAWMGKRYPELAQRLAPLIAANTKAVTEMVNKYQLALDAFESSKDSRNSSSRDRDSQSAVIPLERV